MRKAKGSRAVRRASDDQAQVIVNRMEETSRAFLERIYELEVERMRLFRLALTKLDREKLSALQKRVEETYTPKSDQQSPPPNHQ